MWSPIEPVGNIRLGYGYENSGLLKEPPENLTADSPHILYQEALTDYPPPDIRVVVRGPRLQKFLTPGVLAAGKGCFQPESAYPWTNPTAAGSADSPVLSVSKRSAVPESRRPVRLALRAPSAARQMWPTDVGLGTTSPRSRCFVERSWVTSVTTVTLKDYSLT